MELNLNVLGVARRLEKNIVHLSKSEIEKKLFFFSQDAQTTNDQLLISRNFRGQCHI